MANREAEGLRAACMSLYDVAGHAMMTCAPMRGRQRYESSLEGSLQQALVVRYVEAITCVGRDGQENLPSAIVLARSALEASIRGRWMLQPDSPWQREERWLVLQDEVRSYRERLPTRLRDVSPDVEPEDYKAFVESVGKALKVELLRAGLGETKYKRPISTSSMLLTLGLKHELYPHYSWLSQWAHGTSASTRTYRKGLGRVVELGEFVELRQWLEVMRIGFHAMDDLTIRLLRVAASLPEYSNVPVDYLTAAQREEMRFSKLEALASVEGNSGLTAADFPVVACLLNAPRLTRAYVRRAGNGSMIDDSLPRSIRRS